MPQQEFQATVNAPVEQVFGWYMSPLVVERLAAPWQQVRVQREEGSPGYRT